MPDSRAEASTAGRHPSLDVLERYMINHLPPVEAATVERHVFACDICVSRAQSLDMEVLAMAKACQMLSSEEEGRSMQVLPVPVLVPERQYVIAPIRRPQRMRYATAAAAAIVLAATVHSLVVQDRNRLGTPPRTAFGPAVTQIASSHASVSPFPAYLDDPVPIVRASTRKPIRARTPVRIVPARYTRPFVLPARHIRTPEVNMAYAGYAPAIAAPRMEPAIAFSKPGVPKKPIRGPKRVLRAIAFPFKKLGVLASLAARSL